MAPQFVWYYSMPGQALLYKYVNFSPSIFVDSEVTNLVLAIYAIYSLCGVIL